MEHPNIPNICPNGIITTILWLRGISKIIGGLGLVIPRGLFIYTDLIGCGRPIEIPHRDSSSNHPLREPIGEWIRLNLTRLETTH